MSELTKLQQIQVILGVQPDDIWGDKSQAVLDAEKAAARARWQGSAAPQTDSSTAKLRWPLEADAESFYGASDGSSKWEAEHLVSFPVPYAMFMDGQPVRTIKCHRLVMPSLQRILSRIREHYKTPEAIRAVGLDQYDGCYNYRNVRGAGHLSMHAYGAAIDFDAAHNELGEDHGRMPKEAVEIFKAEGWRWGGDYQHRKDWMHFEACR